MLMHLLCQHCIHSPCSPMGHTPVHTPIQCPGPGRAALLLVRQPPSKECTKCEARSQQSSIICECESALPEQHCRSLFVWVRSVDRALNQRNRRSEVFDEPVQGRNNSSAPSTDLWNSHEQLAVKAISLPRTCSPITKFILDLHSPNR